MKKYGTLTAAVLAAVAGLGASAFAQCPTLQIGSTPNAVALGEVDIGNNCDDCTSLISLPFPVAIYGISYGQATVSSNGTIQFGSDTASFFNTCPLPSATFIGGPTILPHWDDLRTDQLGGSGRGIFTSESGAPGARRFNIEWRTGLFRSTSESVNFVVSFYENQSYFDVFYIDVAQSGSDASAGVQANGTPGSTETTLSCNAPNLTSGSSFRYFCPSTFGPIVNLAVDPNTGSVGQTLVAAATVASGVPASAITGVSLNAGSIDGGTVVLLDNGVAPDGTANDGVYSGNVLIGPGASNGFQVVSAVATDALGRTGQGSNQVEIIPLPPSNDDCSAPIAVVDGSNAVSNEGATSDGSSASCGFGFDGVEVYYSYTATATGPIQVDLCGGVNFNAIVSVLDACFGTEISCSDFSDCGPAAAVFEAVQGQTYIIRMADLFGSDTGTGTMTIGTPTPTGIESFGAANPDPATAGDSTLLEVFVTPGTNPTSTGLAVTVDTSTLQNGNAAQTMYDDGTNGDQFAGDNVFSFLQPIEVEQAEQTYEFAYIVTDNESRSDNGSIFLNVDVSNPDALFSSFTPFSGFAGTIALYEVVVIPALFPDSTGLSVTADFSSLLGSASQPLFDDGTNGDLVSGDGTFSFAITIDGSLGAGNYLIPVTSVIDDQGRVDDFLPGATFTVRVPSQWEEIADGGGDAGDLPATALIPSGTDPFTSLGGTVETGSDVDMFLINICDEASFVATTVGTGTAFDTMLWLFNTDGTGVVANDDSQGTLQSTLTSNFVNSNGNYYLAIDRFFVRAVDATGAFLWTTTAEAPPSNPNPVAGWAGTGFNGNPYRIALSGVCFADSGPTCDYDFNQDENVDLLDAQQMAQVFVGLITPGAGWLDGDLNGDENADLTDAQILAAFVVSGNCNL